MSSTASRSPSTSSGVVARASPTSAGQHQDARVVVADAELADRADHAVGDVAVGLARGDREAAGQHRAGQRDDDEVADGEVVRAADDAARLGARRRRPGTSGSSCRSSAARRRTTAPGRRRAGRRCVGARSRRASTSRPTRTSASASSRGGRCRPAGRRARRSQDTGRASDLHPEGRGEPDVALDHVAHVGDVVAEHQRALDAHAEREAGVALGVDAAGDAARAG